MNWIDCKELLPGNKYGWVIIRCVCSNVINDVYYFMAMFQEGMWHFLDDEKLYEKKMTVTHWCIPDKIL